MNVTMANRDALVEQLRAVPLFAACSRGDLKIVARHTAQVNIPAKATIVTEGERGDSFYVLMSGQAAVRRKSGRANRKVADLTPGGYFGELAILDPAPRNASVEAVTDCVVAVIDARVFRALVRDVPAMSEKLLAGLARRLRDADLTVG